MSSPKPEAQNWDIALAQNLAITPEFTLDGYTYQPDSLWPGDKKSAKKYRKHRDHELGLYQEQFFVQPPQNGTDRILVILSGPATSGKTKLVRHLLKRVNPLGIKLFTHGDFAQVQSPAQKFAVIQNQLSTPGTIGLCHESYYPSFGALGGDSQQLSDSINSFEEDLAASGVKIIKLALLISAYEQGKRLQDNLTDPKRQWSYKPEDTALRANWEGLQSTYLQMLKATSTEAAPWLAIPADESWFAKLCLTEALTQALESLGLSWPAPNYDVVAQQKALALTMPPFTN